MNKYVLFLSKYINQFETNIERCVVPSLIAKIEKNSEEKEEEEEGGEASEEEIDHLPTINKELSLLKPYQQTDEIQIPHLCTWEFMGKEELECFLKITTRSELREKLEEKLGKVPSGFSRIVAMEFLVDVSNFCRKSTFNLEQSGSILSIFYWTHRFFTSNLFVCPEDVHSYFLEFLVFHSLNLPPTHSKIFDVDEGKAILTYFCRLYLRHLPLVRMLTLPNFGFELEYVLEPEMKMDKSKKGKDKEKAKKGKKK